MFLYIAHYPTNKIRPYLFGKSLKGISSCNYNNMTTAGWRRIDARACLRQVTRMRTYVRTPRAPLRYTVAMSLHRAAMTGAWKIFRKIPTRLYHSLMTATILPCTRVVTAVPQIICYVSFFTVSDHVLYTHNNRAMTSLQNWQQTRK